MKTFRVKVLSPEGLIKEAEYSSANLPTTEGQVTILKNHEPYMATLRAGIVALSLKGKVEPLLVTSGFAKFENNLLTLTCEVALVSGEEVEAEVKKALELSKERRSEAMSEEERALLEARLSKSLKGLRFRHKIKHH